MDLFNNFEISNIANQHKLTQFDLPDADISLYEVYFSKQECEKLFHQLNTTILWKHEHIKLFGKSILQPRLTAFYGDENANYSYSGINNKPLAWTDDLFFIKSRVEQITQTTYNCVLLNYYRNQQDSMGWHSDNENELGINPIIASVSFGETRPLQLRHVNRKDLHKINIPLNDGSILLMKGTTQHFWQHQIPKTTRMLKPRINLTFRNII